MTTVAQGIIKATAIVKQSALGSPGSTGGQVLRRITSVFAAPRDTFESNEIRTDEQSSGVAYGLKKTTGKISGLLSPATYKLLFASSLRKDFAAGSSTTAIATVTSASTSGAAGTFTRASGSYLTDGFKIGDIVQWTGFATTGAVNNSVNMLITALTALIMTVTRFDSTAIGAKAAGDTVTGTVVGKKSIAPLTGHTNDYFSVEEWYSDIAQSELFTDVKVNQIQVGLPATGNATFSCDLLGLGRTNGTAQVLTSPTAQTTTPIMTAVNGVIYVNGTATATVTGAQLTIADNVTAGNAVIGSNSAVDLSRGRIKVSGQFTGLFTDTVITALYNAETNISLLLICMDNPASVTSKFISFNMGAIKITNDAPDDGEKAIVRTYTFVAEINTAGGAALANDQTILSIQDSDA